jgi:hypothetical protein
MDNFLIETIFYRCPSNPNVYNNKVSDYLVIPFLYVDNLILTSRDPKLLNHVKSILREKFDMIDLGHSHYFIGVQVFQSKECISISQAKYACDLICCFHMKDYKLAPSPF